MNRIYLSGPMTGLPEFNFPAFNAAAAALSARGYEVINPASFGVNDAMVWADYLRRDIAALVDCDGVVLLPGWGSSKGARLEEHIARELGMPVLTIDEVLEAVEA